MTKLGFIMLCAILLTALPALLGFSKSIAQDYGIQRRTTADDAWINNRFSPATGNSLLMFDAVTSLPKALTATAIGLSLITATTAISARTIIGAGTSTFSGAYADLSGKPTLATVATTGSYTDLTNKPAITTVQGTRTTSNAAGTGTWVFTTPFASTPSIALTAFDTSGALINLNITAVSPTQTSYSLTRTVINLIGLLGLSLPVLQAPQATPLHILAVGL